MLGTDVFTVLAREAASALGLPALPVATVPHPIGGLEPPVVATKAEVIVERVAARLTTEAENPAARGASAAPIVDAPDDLDEFQAFAIAAAWGDGLPVLPPTPERVERVLGTLAATRKDVVTILPPRLAEATVEAIAANAALAGALPEYLPVIIAAVTAMTRPEFNLEAIQATTHPCGPLVIVNGPIVERLGIACGANALGGGTRANAAIGRAVRFVLVNVGGARPGTVDRATLGHPGKYTYCLGENEAASPWEPLHVERGFRADDSCVTVCASEAPHNVNDHGSRSAAALLMTIAGTAAVPGSNNIYIRGEPLVVLGPEHARTIADSGWSKKDFKRTFWERARLPLSRISPDNLPRFAVYDPERFRDPRPDQEVPLCPTPNDVMVVVAGGPGKHSVIIPTFGATRSVTLAIDA